MGDGVASVQGYSNLQKAVFIPGTRLKLQTLGGAWVARLWSLMHGQSFAPWVIRLDADAMIYRPVNPKSLPSDGDLIGEVRETPWNLPYIRGGCIGYSRQALKLLNQNLPRLNNSKYKREQRWGYLRSHSFRFPGESEARVAESHEDFIVGDIAQQLGLRLRQWDENYIEFRGLVPCNQDKRYAVMHPIRGLCQQSTPCNNAMAIKGKMAFEELMWLWESASSCKRVVEVGSWQGRSASVLASALRESGGILSVVDSWEDPNEMAAFYDNMEFLGHNPQVFRLPSVEGAKQFNDRSLDMVFIDADHEEESVLEDVISWLPKVRSGGLLCGHDYSPRHPGVVAAVDSLLPGARCEVGSIWAVRI